MWKKRFDVKVATLENIKFNKFGRKLVAATNDNRPKLLYKRATAPNSTSFTWKGSLVQIQYRPLASNLFEALVLSRTRAFYLDIWIAARFGLGHLGMNSEAKSGCRLKPTQRCGRPLPRPLIPNVGEGRNSQNNGFVFNSPSPRLEGKGLGDGGQPSLKPSSAFCVWWSWRLWRQRRRLRVRCGCGLGGGWRVRRWGLGGQVGLGRLWRGWIGRVE